MALVGGIAAPFLTTVVSTDVYGWELDLGALIVLYYSVPIGASIAALQGGVDVLAWPPGRAGQWPLRRAAVHVLAYLLLAYVLIFHVMIPAHAR